MRRLVLFDAKTLEGSFWMKTNTGRLLVRSLLVVFLLSAVGQAQTPSFSDNLAKLKDKREAVRIAAVKALGRSGDDRAIEPLIEVLKTDEDLLVGEEAVLALGNFRDLRAVRGVLAALGTTNGNAHEAANKVLKNFGAFAMPPMIEALADLDSDVGRNLIDAFEFIGAPAVDALIATLSNPQTQGGAMQALGRIKNPRAIQPLIALLKDPEAYVRRDAASALGDIGDARAIDAIRPLLKDSDLTVRVSAAYALGEMKDAGSVDEIALLLSEDDNDVKKEIGAALSKINSPRAIEHLMGAAKKRDLAVVAGGYPAYLRRLTPALTTTLLDALEEFGGQEMAEAFLRSGNRRLAAEARSWAKENGYVIFSVPNYGTGRRRRG